LRREYGRNIFFVERILHPLEGNVPSIKGSTIQAHIAEWLFIMV